MSFTHGSLFRTANPTPRHALEAMLLQQQGRCAHERQQLRQQRGSGAAQHGVGLATVRTQIGCIRSKVGAQSIRDLLRMVGTLPPMLSALRVN